MNIAVIQARLTSTRLPNKMLLCLHGHPVISWVIKRVKKSKKIDMLIVAIPDNIDQKALVTVIEKEDVSIFKGSETNVLERMYSASKDFNYSNFIRICGDNPIISWNLIDELIDFHIRKKNDYSYNHIPKNNLFPDGLGAEIITKSALEFVYRSSKTVNEKEHMFNFIWNNINEFKIGTYSPAELRYQKPDYKLDLDTYDDYIHLIKNKFELDMDSFQIMERIYSNDAI